MFINQALNYERSTVLYCLDVFDTVMRAFKRLFLNEKKIQASRTAALLLRCLFYPRPEQVARPKADWETSSVASSGYGTDRESGGGSRKREYDDDRSSHSSKFRRDDNASSLSRSDTGTAIFWIVMSKDPAVDANKVD